MKRNLFYLLMMVCSLSIFVSCKDDDDVEYIKDGEFDGVYMGTLDVDAVDLITVNDIPQKIYITKTGENLFKMELKNFWFKSIEIGTIVVDNISVTKTGESCTFKGNSDLKLVVGQCAVTVDGTITGKNTKIIIGVNVSDGLKVNVDFEGSKMDTDKSSEAKMLTFVFEDNSLIQKQPVIDGTNITFTVLGDITDEQLAELVPTFTISQGATVDKESGVKQNFKNPVKYTVTSEDGIYKTEYSVTAVVGKLLTMSFDEWTTVNTQNGDYDFPVGTWGGTNEGMAMINVSANSVGKGFEMPVTAVEGHNGDGKAAMLKSIHTEIDMGANGFLNDLLGLPYLTAGSLFTGTFNTDPKDFLNSTKFGIPYDGMPVTFTGWYKYTPGTKYYNADNTVAEGVVDKCSVYAVLYEELLENGKNVPLTGHDITNSSRIVLRAVAADGSAKAEWTEFNVPFQSVEGRTYDPNKKYYLAVICASSDKGDTYNGAEGSTLVVDDFKIIAE